MYVYWRIAQHSTGFDISGTTYPSVSRWNACGTVQEVTWVMSDDLVESDRRVPEVRQGHINGRWSDRYRRVCVLHRLDAISTHDDQLRDRQYSAADGWKYVWNRLFSSSRTRKGMPTTNNKNNSCNTLLKANFEKIVMPRPAYGALSLTALSAGWPWPMTFWPLNRFTGYSCDGFHPANFGLPRSFRSRVRSRQMTDRQTDRRRTDRHWPSFYNAHSYRGWA